jgi:hypothetical protein
MLAGSYDLMIQATAGEMTAVVVVGYKIKLTRVYLTLRASD